MQARWGRHLCWTARVLVMHPRPPGRHIAIDIWPLILSFKLKFFVCWHVSMWGFQNPVCPYPEKRNHLIFVNISPTLVIDTSMERSSRELHPGNTKISFQKGRNCILTCSKVLKLPLLSQYQSTYICVNYMHICVSTSLHHCNFIL